MLPSVSEKLHDDKNQHRLLPKHFTQILFDLPCRRRPFEDSQLTDRKVKIQFLGSEHQQLICESKSTQLCEIEFSGSARWKQRERRNVHLHLERFRAMV